MKRLACAIGLLALALTATSPPRARTTRWSNLTTDLPDLVGQRRHTLGRRLDETRYRLAPGTISSPALLSTARDRARRLSLDR